jgi:hypothetical protein
MLGLFLSAVDAERAQRVLQKLARHDIQKWILTGGFAVEIHHLIRGADPIRRTLGDIDFTAASFEYLPKGLGKDFLFRHVHPLDPPGKTMLQAVDADELVRVDVFNDGGAVLKRTQIIALAGAETPMVSAEDLLARMARLSLDIGYAEAVPAKHVRDFLRLLALADADAMEAVWPYHRRPKHPSSFQTASELLQSLIPNRQHLLITPDYSNDINEVCPRCRAPPHFELADPKRILSLWDIIDRCPQCCRRCIRGTTQPWRKAVIGSTELARRAGT